MLQPPLVYVFRIWGTSVDILLIIASPSVHIPYLQNSSSLYDIAGFWQLKFASASRSRCFQSQI